MSEPLTVLAREKPLRARARSKKPEAGDTLAFQIKAILKMEVQREYKFHPQRKWRFDLVLPLNFTAIELNGGIWRKGGGAHTGTGHLRDMEKMNAAQKLGWRVFQFTPEQVFSGEAINFLESMGWK